MSDGQNKDGGFNKEDFFSALFNPDVPFNYKIIFGLTAIVYTISPIDLIPDLLGPLGFADDVGVLVIAAQTFTHFANQALKKQAKRKEQPETIIMDQPGPHTASAQSAEAEAKSEPQQTKPRLPESHLRRHHAAQAENADYRPVPKPPSTEALHDERHEKFIREKQSRSNETFDDLINATKTRGETDKEEWDFSRNDPFAKKRDKKQ